MKFEIVFWCDWDKIGEWQSIDEALEMLASVVMTDLKSKKKPMEFEIFTHEDEERRHCEATGEGYNYINRHTILRFKFNPEFPNKAEAILWVVEIEKKIKKIWEEKKDFLKGAKATVKYHSIEEIK